MSSVTFVMSCGKVVKITWTCRAVVRVVCHRGDCSRNRHACRRNFLFSLRKWTCTFTIPPPVPFGQLAALDISAMARCLRQRCRACRAPGRVVVCRPLDGHRHHHHPASPSSWLAPVQPPLPSGEREELTPQLLLELIQRLPTK